MIKLLKGNTTHLTQEAIDREKEKIRQSKAIIQAEEAKIDRCQFFIETMSYTLGATAVLYNETFKPVDDSYTEPGKPFEITMDEDVEMEKGDWLVLPPVGRIAKVLDRGGEDRRRLLAQFVDDGFAQTIHPHFEIEIIRNNIRRPSCKSDT